MKSRQITAVGLTLVLLLSSIAIPVTAAGGLNFNDDGAAPNPGFNVDTVTVDSWNNSEFDSATEYYDDSGDIAELPGELNKSSDYDDLGTGTVNPISVTATDWDVEEFGEFPRKGDETDNEASVLDAGEWTASGTNADVSSASTAPGVDAVEISGGAGTDQSTYSNFSIDSDAEKRYLQLAADVASATGTPKLYANDTDGDYVAIDLYNSAENQSASSVLANETGEGHVAQVQVGELTVEGTGDGKINEIDELTVAGDISIKFSLINVEKTSKYTFGERYVDDGDDGLETETIYEPHGEYSVHSVSTFGQVFADATAKGLSFPATVEAKHLSSDDVNASFKSDNAFPQWDAVADIYYRLELPDAYDLSYSGVTLDQDQRWPGTRYASVEISEDVGDTDFEDIDGWNSQSSSFDSQDSTHTLDDTVSVGTAYAVHIQLKLTEDEASSMQAGGGSMPFEGNGDGGWIDAGIDFIIGLPGLLMIALAGVAGRFKGVW